MSIGKSPTAMTHCAISAFPRPFVLQLTFASPMEHLQEENRRLKSELEELAKSDGSGMASQVMKYVKDVHEAKSKLREAEKRVRQLEAERKRTPVCTIVSFTFRFANLLPTCARAARV